MKILLLAGLLTASLVSPMSAPKEKTRILLIGHKHDHPPQCHMYLETCRVLAKCLMQTPGVEAVVSDGWPTDPNVLKGVKAIVLYTSPGGTILLEDAHRAEAERLLKEGVGYTAIHWATDAKPEVGEAYLKVLGGWFHTDFSKLSTTISRLTQSDPKHEICRGWSDYESREEFYLDLKFEPSAKPLVTAIVDGKDQVVAWTYERPESKKGRSFGTTLGHFYDTYRKESFRRLLINGILWTAHVKVPKDGAPCRAVEVDFP